MRPQKMAGRSYADEIDAQFGDWESGKSRYLWRRRLEAALPHLPSSGKVLDVGCGDVFAIERLKERLPDIEPFAADIRRMRPFQGAVRSDCRSLPFKDDLFDAVLMLAVIEHVPDHSLALLEMRRVLKKGGALVVTTPNPLFGIPTAIAGRLGLKYREGYDNGVSLERLSETAAEAGLEVEVELGFLALPFATPLERIEGAVGRHRIWRKLLMNQLMVARKR